MSPSSKALSDPATETATDTSLRDLLGEPPLLQGENGADFEALYDRVSATVGPRDAIEEIWVRDVVDILWEILRLRRLKTNYMRSMSHAGVEKLLEPRVDYRHKNELTKGWALRDREPMKEVKAMLKQSGLDEKAIEAQTFVANIETLERIDRMLMQLKTRRNIAFREIDRHRAVLAQRLRELALEIEDAAFTEIAP